MIPYSVARLRTRRRKNDSGKFKQSRRLGVSMSGTGEHNGWRFEVSRARVGVTVRRDVFSLTIRDEEGSMLHRLTGFTNRDQATLAARRWIDEAQALMNIRIDREHRQKGMRALKRVATIETKKSTPPHS
jgi:hypothetical protein